MVEFYAIRNSLRAPSRPSWDPAGTKSWKLLVIWDLFVRLPGSFLLLWQQARGWGSFSWVGHLSNKKVTNTIFGWSHSRTYQRGAFYSAFEIHDFLYLATACWQFCTLCIWFLTKLLWIRLKSPSSYICRKIIYVHAMYHRQKLNFSSLFCLEDGKKYQRTGKPALSKVFRAQEGVPTPQSGSPATKTT